MTVQLWRRLSPDGKRYMVMLTAGFHASAPNICWSQVVGVDVALGDMIERVAAMAWEYFASTSYGIPPAGSGLTNDDIQRTCISRHKHPRLRGFGSVDQLDVWLADVEHQGEGISVCGRFRDTRSWADYRDALASVSLRVDLPVAAPNLEAREQVRPTDAISGFRRFCVGSDEGVEWTRFRWWLVPWFHRGTLKEWKFSTFNARAETVRTSRTFKDAFARRRCLIAADAWYEWTGPRSGKQMWLFEPKDRQPIMFAGLWDRADTSDQGIVESATIITQPAGAPLNGYHDRAPVVLRMDDWATWLDLEANVDHLLGSASADLYDVSPYTPIKARNE